MYGAMLRVTERRAFRLALPQGLGTIESTLAFVCFFLITGQRLDFQQLADYHITPLRFSGQAISIVRHRMSIQKETEKKPQWSIAGHSM
ncbi:hypothetical protein AU255_10600 [Methyloprofundus sedimenti]|uniref:Uncharacterized protein n=1 Tax=Methyloprofundus sedimenti TaxID=1420851 RepID=A0A1V8M9T4_9GAMM|nr:hypothetical protein AU255_10600 [Methyloprofundus sedimenti]